MYNFIQEQDFDGKTYAKWDNKHSPFIRIEIKGNSQTSSTALFYSNLRNSYPSETIKIDCNKENSVANFTLLLSQIMSVLCSLISIKSINKLKAKHCKIVYFIIINEKKSKESLKFFLKKNTGLLGSVAQIIFVESIIKDYSKIWLTDSCRGFVQYNVKIPEEEKSEYIHEKLKKIENSLVVSRDEFFQQIVIPTNKDKVILQASVSDKQENYLIYKVCGSIPASMDSGEIFQKIKDSIDYFASNDNEEENGDLSLANLNMVEECYSGFKIAPKLLQFINQASKKYFNQNDFEIIQSPFTIFGIDELINKFYQSDILILGISKIVYNSLEINSKYCEKFICFLAEVAQQLNQYE